MAHTSAANIAAVPGITMNPAFAAQMQQNAKGLHLGNVQAALPSTSAPTAAALHSLQGKMGVRPAPAGSPALLAASLPQTGELVSCVWRCVLCVSVLSAM